MTPIISKYDVRLTVLIGAAINTIESLALAVDKEPAEILAETLYLTNKYVHEYGEECYMNKLTTHYPLLEETIR